MMRSMFAAISGLRNHQTFLDVVGNNLANVNTVGFKMARVTFQDILSQTVRGPSSSTATTGGINPAQVGLGMLIGGIDTIQSQGNLQSTSKPTDLALQGDGYFVLSDGAQQVFARDGSFDIATDGRLVSPNTGFVVQGWNAVAGVINSSVDPVGISIPIGKAVIGQVSTQNTLNGNLNANAAAPFSTVISSYDALGGLHKVTVEFTKTGANTWTWTAVTADVDGSAVTYIAGDTDTVALRTITFDGATGAVLTPAGNKSITITPAAAGGAAAYALAIDFTELTQLVSANEVTSSSDGASAGSLVSFSIGNSGEISGIYSNGLNQTLGQIAIASFTNPGGLVREGSNVYTTSSNSGAAQIGLPGTGGRGQLSAGFLEMSNVDLAQQFTNMIIAERGFQANSRVITTSDEMLLDLVNLKR